MTYRILVALDGSPASEAALHEVEQIAVGGAAVHLLHVVPMLPLDTKTTSAEVRASHDQGRSYLDKLRERLPDVRGLDLIRTGDPADAILQTALEFDIDLIAMGAPVLLGGVAQTVVQGTLLPVLLRRPGSRFDQSTIRRILVPQDGSEDSLTILPAVRNLALQVRAEVVFLHVSLSALAPALSEVRASPDPKPVLLRLAERFDKSDLVFWQTIAEGDPVEEILNHAQTLDADLIAMPAPAAKESERTTLGRAALAVLERSSRGVLLQRPVAPRIAPHPWMFQ